MRPVHRPLKQIARPHVSSAQMNETAKKNAEAGVPISDGSVSVDELRREFLSKGAYTLPLVVSRRDMKELRHHIMRLQSKGRVDVLNDDQFTPPIRLHRRDPRAPPSGAGSHFDDEDTKEDLEESKERERLEIAKEERRKIREENLAKIAPTGTKKPPAFQKKTEQKFRPDDTPEAEKRRLLKYEETLPWHLEDFENKQTWVGVYESELSEAHVMLTTAFENGRDVIQMVPLERWYKFSVKGKVQQVNVDEVDERIKKQEKLPTFLSNIEQRSIKREQEHAMRGPRMRTRIGGGDDDEGAPRRRRGGDDDATYRKREEDADDIDFNMEEDFADDEEGLNGLFEGEEADVKDAHERLKRDQLGAAAFDLRNEDDIYRQEEREKEEAEKAKLLEKSIRKALKKREKNPDVDYDSDRSNPYESSSSDSETDSETERQRTKEEEERKAAEQNGKGEDDKPASGTSTKGTNTPSGSHKPGDINKKKRPGSPNLSEASGNESSRKKHKKKHDKHADGSRKSSLMHNDVSKRGAASGSESEMTDAGKKKKQKLKVRLGGSPSGSPGGSRAGSPAASQVNGSRAGSPAAPARKLLHTKSCSEITVLTTKQKRLSPQQVRFTKHFLLKVCQYKASLTVSRAESIRRTLKRSSDSLKPYRALISSVAGSFLYLKCPQKNRFKLLCEDRRDLRRARRLAHDAVHFTYTYWRRIELIDVLYVCYLRLWLILRFFAERDSYSIIVHQKVCI